jgi:predicted Zn-dependent protease with MMP-like domain
LRDRDFDEIADDLLDVAADITDLGEFRGFDLDERRAGEFGEPPRDLGLADARSSGYFSAALPRARNR